MSFTFKSLVLFIKIVTKLLLLRPFGNLIFDLAAKYDNVAIADLRKLEKLSIKEDKAALDLSFLRNCQSLNVLPKFVCFNLPNVSQLDTIAIRKRLLRSATSKRSKEHRRLTIAKEKHIGWLKERLNGLDFYILQKSLCGTIKKNTRKLAAVHDKKLSLNQPKPKLRTQARTPSAVKIHSGESNELCLVHDYQHHGDDPFAKTSSISPTYIKPRKYCSSIVRLYVLFVT